MSRVIEPFEQTAIEESMEGYTPIFEIFAELQRGSKFYALKMVLWLAQMVRVFGLEHTTS